MEKKKLFLSIDILNNVGCKHQTDHKEITEVQAHHCFIMLAETGTLQIK
jgi:hypothetical protein